MGTAKKTLLKKWIRTASNFISLIIIPPHLFRQMLAIFFGIEF